MNYVRIGLIAACLGVGAGVCATGQSPPANGLFNPMSVKFQPLWNEPAPDAAKLIEIGTVGADKRTRLIQLLDYKEKGEYRRKLRVDYWGGSRFITEFEGELQGTAQDTLLAGAFRPKKQGAQPAANPKKKDKTPLTYQIVTTESVYEWDGKNYVRLFAAPIGVKLALTLAPLPDRLVSGSGDAALQYEVTDSEAKVVSLFDLLPDSPGYVRSGTGMQEFLGAEAMNLPSGARYLQSFWSERQKWIVGVLRGDPAPTPDDPKATTGDRILVYVPRLPSRDKSFWNCKPDDLEESWRSAPIAGKLLDVRIGDPKNEGRDGLLALVSENRDKNRRLYFYLAIPARR